MEGVVYSDSILCCSQLNYEISADLGGHIVEEFMDIEAVRAGSEGVL